jgi:hypothetical protein
LSPFTEFGAEREHTPLLAARCASATLIILLPQHKNLLTKQVIEDVIVFNILDSIFYISLYKIICNMGGVERIMTAYLKSLKISIS